ncbi:MAG: TerC/Alx family metal homeostasis membrane protein [Parachlamydiaceae bacterium]
MSATLSQWIGFNVMILLILSIDLWRFFRHPHPIGIKEALLTSLGWVVLAISFNIWIYFTFGSQQGLDFFTGYLLEKSLSIDNLFIFLLLFAHFKVPDTAKHQVLFYGILGAIVMRALLIWGGIALIQHFEWIFIVFGLFLIISGIRLAFHTEKEEEAEEGIVYRWLKARLPFTDSYHGTSFMIKIANQWVATPLLAVVILIETTDLIFALDSVPAILGITTDPFIVYTSNIFAILGLRSLFFALEGIMKTFYLLHYGLAFILVFIGSKMILAHYLDIPTSITLCVIISTLSLSIGASCLFPMKEKKEN